MKWLIIPLVVAIYSVVGYAVAALFESAGCFVFWFGWPILLPIWAYQWCREKWHRAMSRM